jgi:hypothetical protein
VKKASEPIIKLIVALGGPVIVKSVRAIIERRYEHIEKMRKLDVQLRESEMQHEYEMTELRLRAVDDDGKEREVSEDELEVIAGK